MERAEQGSWRRRLLCGIILCTTIFFGRIYFFFFANATAASRQAWALLFDYRHSFGILLFITMAASESDYLYFFCLIVVGCCWCLIASGCDSYKRPMTV
jgi:ascorbate-specific PTS system EIIC-type component UlaA